MRLAIRITLAVASGAVLLAGAAVAQSPATQSPADHVSGSVEHGRYLVHDVAMCVECHSPRDDDGTIIRSQEFMGAPIPFRPPWANDWAMIAPRNKGLPGYDDALAMRLLTEGAIGRDGKQLRPPMPRFRMSKQDASDVIAYMRSLK
jgi:mono/diheme cytochrome c family protein